MSLLWELCSGGQVEEVRAALERGADVNYKNPKNQTVLMNTATECSEKYVSILRLLLEQPSIEVNLADDKGCTALHKATCNGNIEAVKLLLADPRVDVNCKEKHQLTPLMMATIEADTIDIFKLLLADHRVDANWTAPDPVIGDITALYFSFMYSNVEAAKLLLDEPRVDVNWMDSYGMSTLHHMAADEEFNPQLLELFLAHPRVDVNCKSGPLDPLGYRQTILHVAAYKYNVEAVKLILAEPRFISDISVVWVAVITGHMVGQWDVLKELVHHPGIDLGEKDGLDLDDLIR